MEGFQTSNTLHQCSTPLEGVQYEQYTLSQQTMAQSIDIMERWLREMDEQNGVDWLRGQAANMKRSVLYDKRRAIIEEGLADILDALVALHEQYDPKT